MTLFVQGNHLEATLQSCLPVYLAIERYYLLINKQPTEKIKGKIEVLRVKFLIIYLTWAELLTELIVIDHYSSKRTKGVYFQFHNNGGNSRFVRLVNYLLIDVLGWMSNCLL